MEVIKRNINIAWSVGVAWMLGVLIVAYATNNPYPTDQELIENFNQQNPALTELAKLIEKETEKFEISKITKDKVLMKKLQILQFERSKDGEVYFEVSRSNGFIFGGKYKGLIYKRKSAEFLEDSLDDLHFNNEESYGVKKLDENWHLYYDSW